MVFRRRFSYVLTRESERCLPFTVSNIGPNRTEFWLILIQIWMVWCNSCKIFNLFWYLYLVPDSEAWKLHWLIWYFRIFDTHCLILITRALGCAYDFWFLTWFTIWYMILIDYYWYIHWFYLELSRIFRTFLDIFSNFLELSRYFSKFVWLWYCLILSDIFELLFEILLKFCLNRENVRISESVSWKKKRKGNRKQTKRKRNINKEK